jgi:hypothetical protein
VILISNYRGQSEPLDQKNFKEPKDEQNIKPENQTDKLQNET